MTSAECSEGAYSIGWLTSVCLHATLAFGAFIVTQRMTLGPQPPPFTWNVSLVAAPSTQSQPPAALTAHLQTPLNNRPRQEPMVSSLASTQGSAGSIKGAAVEQPAPASQEQILQTDEPPIGDQPISPSHAIPLIAPIVAPEAEPPSESVAPTQPLLGEQVPISTVQTLSMASVVASGPRPDYAWLSETIMRRMEELKKYPAQARLDRVEGKVILKAVIRSDGNVERIEVFQSSGHHSLDLAAVELLNLAAPFQFPRPMERPEMTVKIPMRYRLE